MSIQQYLDEMKAIQETLLDFLDNDAKDKTSLDNLKQILDDQQKFKLTLHLFTRLANNHHRGPNFLSKINQIFSLFKDSIKKYFQNWEIFCIFKKSKIILLNLIEEQILIFDMRIAKEIVTRYQFKRMKYPQFFAPELKPFIYKYWFPENLEDEINQKLPENFYNERRTGGNNSFICKLIQKDLIDDFIVYVNQSNIPLNSTIKITIYESHSFLAKRDEMSLIEYATFYGALQIFKFLAVNNVKLTDRLYSYSIYGNNAEIIHFLEEKHLRFNYMDNYKRLFKRSIRSHHNDIAMYFLNNYLESKDGISQDTFDLYLRYYNFELIQNFEIKDNSFPRLCKYDYYDLVDILLKRGTIDINKAHIK